MSLLRAVSCVLMLACGPAVTGPAEVTGPTEVSTAEPVGSEPLSASAADACIGHATSDPMPTFMAPGGSPEFRRAFGRKVAELGCCLTDDRRDELRGSPLRVMFEPIGSDPADGARAVLRDYDPGSAQESGCVHAIIDTWRMTRAAVSDVVRVSLDPSRRPRSDAASVLLSYPWPR